MDALGPRGYTFDVAKTGAQSGWALVAHAEEGLVRVYLRETTGAQAGLLEVRVQGGHEWTGGTKIRESARVPLEDKLPLVTEVVERKRAELIEWKKRVAESARRAERERLDNAERARKAERERELARAALDQAERWTRASGLRSYAAAGKLTSEWREWILNYADAIDPSRQLQDVPAGERR